MNSTWGVYNVKGRLKGGKETAASNKQAVSYFVRWRVDGNMRRRTFRTRGHANTFRDELLKAKLLGWQADENGWPIDPRSAQVANATSSAVPQPPAGPGYTVETYVEQIWWPTIRERLGDKNRLGHRRNAEVAVQLLRLKQGDPRVNSRSLRVGDSIPLEVLTSDDVKAALVARRRINGRTAGVNQRRIAKASESANGRSGSLDVELLPEVASDGTVRAFHITLKMIIDAASAHVHGDPMKGAAAFAPKPRPSKMSERIVPTLDELFDLADAISTLGPLMADGRPCGARYRSLILCAGTTAPRPGEMVAHQPLWLDWETDPAEIHFMKTEAAVYGAELETHERGRRVRNLKGREEGEFRRVPLIADVRADLLDHFERGYGSPTRTWPSPTGRSHLDWGNIEEGYWKPALETVFAGFAKSALVHATPKILRKTAITWWAEQGISQTLAAEWAGHSEEVARIYYASRSSTTYAREVALLENRR